MKSLYLSACLFVFLWPALGAENPAGQDSPPAGRSADEEREAFQDPFASESQRPKPNRKSRTRCSR